MDERTGMTAFEQYMVAEKTSKHHTGATSIYAAVAGSAALLAAVAGWFYTNAKCGGNRALIQSNEEHNRYISNLLAQNQASERAERINYNNANSPTIKEFISVSQSGNATANATSAANALAAVEQTLLTGAITGQYQQCPQKVSLYSAPQPCGCPGTCG